MAGVNKKMYSRFISIMADELDFKQIIVPMHSESLKVFCYTKSSLLKGSSKEIRFNEISTFIIFILRRRKEQKF